VMRHTITISVVDPPLSQVPVHRWLESINLQGWHQRFRILHRSYSPRPLTCTDSSSIVLPVHAKAPTPFPNPLSVWCPRARLCQTPRRLAAVAVGATHRAGGDQLVGRGIDCLLPLCIRMSQWKDRKKGIAWPLEPDSASGVD